MKNDWLDQLKERLQKEASEPSSVPFDRLRAMGMINERGEVTGHLHQWNAFLAIVEVKPVAGQPRYEAFRCRKPSFGMLGGAEIDISRDSMVSYLKEGKKVITATRDDRLSLWIKGLDVNLSDNGFVRCDSLDDGEDNVGDLPEFKQSISQL